MSDARVPATGGSPGGEMFHVELRQFPNNFCRFNLSESELRSQVLDPWVRGEWVELGERKWNPAQAKLTVLDGPEIPLSQLTMGRGWRNAQRHGREVTEQLLIAASQSALQSSSASVDNAVALADSLGLQILSDLADEQKPLRRAWELAAASGPNSSPSQSLALAERAVGRLLDSGLLVLSIGDPEADLGPSCVDEACERARILGLIDSWEIKGTRARIWMSRS